MTIKALVKTQKLRKPPMCSSETTVFEAAVEIAALNISALAVLDDDVLVGIISDNDIMVCLADSGSDFYNQTVGAWMTDNPVICSAGAKLSTALNLMAKHDVRNVVIKMGNQVITVVSSREILSRVHEEDELKLRVLRGLVQPIKEASVA